LASNDTSLFIFGKSGITIWMNIKFMTADNLPGPSLLTVATNHEETIHIQIIRLDATPENQLVSDVIYSSEDLEKHPEIKEEIRYYEIPLT
jgi:hypothetical protein